MEYKSLILLQEEKPTNQWLVKDSNPKIIRTISDSITNPEQLNEQEIIVMKKLIDFVRYSQNETLNHKENNFDYLRPAVGLAAPQIGSNKQMFFIRINHQEKKSKYKEYAIINPKIVSQSKQIAALETGEGCLSVDIDKKGIVPRSYKIVIEAFDWLLQKEVNLVLRGYPAIVFQHEIDHLNGRLYYDHINKTEPDYVGSDWFLF